jgi:hypothetical protein
MLTSDIIFVIVAWALIGTVIIVVAMPGKKDSYTESIVRNATMTDSRL